MVYIILVFVSGSHAKLLPTSEGVVLHRYNIIICRERKIDEIIVARVGADPELNFQGGWLLVLMRRHGGWLATPSPIILYTKDQMEASHPFPPPSPPTRISPCGVKNLTNFG